jgi:hypothetical protein
VLAVSTPTVDRIADQLEDLRKPVHDERLPVNTSSRAKKSPCSKHAGEQLSFVFRGCDTALPGSAGRLLQVRFWERAQRG